MRKYLSNILPDKLGAGKCCLPACPKIHKKVNRWFTLQNPPPPTSKSEPPVKQISEKKILRIFWPP